MYIIKPLYQKTENGYEQIYFENKMEHITGSGNLYTISKVIKNDTANPIMFTVPPFSTYWYTVSSGLYTVADIATEVSIPAGDTLYVSPGVKLNTSEI